MLFNVQMKFYINYLLAYTAGKIINGNSIREYIKS